MGLISVTAEAISRKGANFLGESIVGKTCGWLQVVAQVDRPADANPKIRGTWWLCRCECGKEKIFPRQYITQRNVSSCGCKKEIARQNAIEMARKVRKGEKKKREKVNNANGYDGFAQICECPQCGESYERLGKNWAYKMTIGTHLAYFCTWHCLQKAREKRTKKSSI